MSTTGQSRRPPSSQPTLYDVSRLCGVSSATVSRVFSGRTRVSDAVRRRVEDAARQLSYEPSHAARALAGARTQTLGAVFPEIASGFYSDVLAGIDEVAAEGGFDVLASFVGRTRSRPDLVRRLLRGGRVDALVLMNLDDSPDLDAELSAAGSGATVRPPIVLVDHEIAGSGLPVIGADNVGGGEAMIEHLHAQGHRRIAIVTGPDGNFDSDQRLLGCRRAFDRLGLPDGDRLVWRGDFSLESGARVAREALAAGGRLPDAFFCLNDLMAIGMLGEFGRAGVSVPGDVAVAGYDNIETAAHVQLTSVASPMRELGRTAARWAVDLVTTGEPPRSRTLPVELVVRRSSAGRRAAE